jgi:hypothetical protein
MVEHWDDTDSHVEELIALVAPFVGILVVSSLGGGRSDQ